MIITQVSSLSQHSTFGMFKVYLIRNNLPTEVYSNQCPAKPSSLAVDVFFKLRGMEKLFTNHFSVDSTCFFTNLFPDMCVSFFDKHNMQGIDHK